MNKKETKEEKEKEELWCNYSDLPSPQSYMEPTVEKTDDSDDLTEK